MAKITLTDPASLSNEASFLATIAANNALIETAIENTLSRDGTSPNTLSATLDANSNRIINLPAPVSNADAARKIDVVSMAAGDVDNATALADGLMSKEDKDKLDRIVSVRDFGALGDNSTNDTAAFLAAIAELESDSDYRGGILHIPAGRYIVNSTLAFSAYNGVHNIIVRGDGVQATTLEFSGATAGTDGISFDAGAHFGVEHLTIRSAKRHGISINVGGTPGSGSYASRFTFKDLRIQSSTTSAIDMTNCYLGLLEQIWARNGTNGIACRGYHTTIVMDRVHAESNSGVGFALNGMTGSTFISCAADRNDWGFTLTNMSAAKFLGCYGEQNTRNLFYLRTSTASVGSLPAQTQDLSGISFDGCWGYANSYNSTGTYAGFIDVETANSRPVSFEAANCNDYTGGGGTHVSVTMSGVSGAVRAHLTRNSFEGLINEFNVCYVSGDNSGGLTTTAEVVATNGGTLAWPTPNINYVSLTPAGTIAGYTITLPSNPKTGTVVRVSTTAEITTLTISGGTNNGPTTLAAGASFALCYFLPANAWRRCQ